MTHTRRCWRPVVLALALGLVLTIGLLTPTSTSGSGSLPAPPVRQNRPNIVVLMADDMRADDLRWMPQTRRLIGAYGAKFVNSFAPYPLCCPSRASFLTGQYTHNHGVWSHHPPYGFSAFDDSSTFPVWLRNAGYRTMFVGKYLNGYGKRPPPDGSSSVRYVPPGWTDWRGSLDGGLEGNDRYDGGTYRYWDMTLNVNGIFEPHQGEYSTQMLGRKSVSLINANAPASKPFFLWSSFVAPHHGRPYEADDPGPVPRSDGETTQIKTPAVPGWVRGRFDDQIRKAAGLPSERDVSDKPDFIRAMPPINEREATAMLEGARQRAESLFVLDEQVAKIIRALRANRELRNTYVMFTSDNGYFQGEHRKRQGKTLPYDPSLRVPMLLRGPAIPHGVKRYAPFLTIDVAPTVLKATGGRLRASIDGQPRLGVARSGTSAWRRPVLTETGPHKAVDPNKPFTVGVRVRRFLYVEHLSDEKELYHMQRDPKQHRNLVDVRKYNDEQRRLARILRDLRECNGAECRRTLSTW